MMGWFWQEGGDAAAKDAFTIRAFFFGFALLVLSLFLTASCDFGGGEAAVKYAFTFRAFSFGFALLVLFLLLTDSHANT